MLVEKFPHGQRLILSLNAAAFRKIMRHEEKCSLLLTYQIAKKKREERFQIRKLAKKQMFTFDVYLFCRICCRTTWHIELILNFIFISQDNDLAVYPLFFSKVEFKKLFNFWEIKKKASRQKTNRRIKVILYKE